jgi:glycosyltransferase involved in cell wall biosynthesis
VRLIFWTGHAHKQPGVAPLRDPRERGVYDGFAMVSRWQREQFILTFGIDPTRAGILRYAVAPSFAKLFPDNSPILPQKAWPLILAYTSTPFRGLDLLLEAFPVIRAAIPNARLQVFSSMKVYQLESAREQADYGALYDRCRKTDGIEYVGSVPQPELARRLRPVMLLAYPNSFAETACIAVMEAMASGCQIVTSDLGALPETTAGFGHLFSVHQPRQAYLAQFVDRVIRLLRESSEQPAATESLLRAQVNMCNTACTWAVRASEWIGWLNSLPAYLSYPTNSSI